METCYWSVLAEGFGERKGLLRVCKPFGGWLDSFVILGRGFCIICTDKQVCNVMSVNRDWKSAGSRVEIISMSNILFLLAMISGVGCILENWISYF